MVNPGPDGAAMFKILRGAVGDAVGPRVGTLSLPGRRPIDTPGFIGITARGVVPHVTPDNVTNKSDLGGVYIALEDFPPLLEIKSGDVNPLHAFTATPSHMVTVLAARRHPAINSPLGNSKEAISIYTSTGFQMLTNEAYLGIVKATKPDVVIPIGDMTYCDTSIAASSKRRVNVNSSKRHLRMVERTEDWLAQFLEGSASVSVDGDDKAAAANGQSKGQENADPAVFAPLLPVSYATQWDYFNRLEQDHASKLSGLAVYDVDVLPELENHRLLISLPRLSLHYTTTPQEILRQVHLGIDVFTVSFLNSISDAGIALSFTFPPPPSSVSSSILPLGIDMWSPSHAVAVSPLVPGCPCYACTSHHRAFIHHLLNAKEMLGWTLLQLHNHHIISAFFAGIRASLNASSSTSASTFEEDCDRFNRMYDSEFPKGTGTRPRARGYNFKSQGGDDRMNPPGWEKYGNGGDPAEMAGLAVTGARAEGGMETPLVPDGDAGELDGKGFVEVARA
ncbi:tRNA-guanine transglycosylase [Astrocystis sublimbata]|nr:tRNA-guanine transglycosylase [Astrocystis sublimbata]